MPWPSRWRVSMSTTLLFSPYTIVQKSNAVWPMGPCAVQVSVGARTLAARTCSRDMQLQQEWDTAIASGR